MLRFMITSSETSALSVSNLKVCFGGLTAVNDVSLTIPTGKITSIIGPNGAGKTSLFNAITGVHPPSGGSVLVHGVLAARSFDLKALLFICAVICLSALFFVFVFHLVPLWEHVIVSQYRYLEPFSWTNAITGFFQYFLATHKYSVLLPAVVGGSIGGLGRHFLWRRSVISPEVLATLGVARTFQNIRLLAGHSVRENVMLGMSLNDNKELQCYCYCGRGRGRGRGWRWWQRWWHNATLSTSLRRKISSAAQRAEEILKIVGLSDVVERDISELSYGQRRRVEIARALGTSPSILLLDEPAAGMNPVEILQLMGVLRAINEGGVTVCLIEHHMKVVMGISDYIYVLNYGRLIASGSPQEIASHGAVIEAYLGKQEGVNK